MKRVLLTGGSGFIGRHAVAPLLRGGYDVHAVGRRPVTGVTSHGVDLMDRRAIGELLAEVRPTHLLHFAWYAEHGRFWASPLNVDWVATTLVLFRAFAEAGGQRAVFAGTCAEYDWTGDPHLFEDVTPSRPATLYGTCKNGLRQIVAKAGGPAVAWGRIFFLYGPDEHQDRLVPSILRPLQRGEPAVVRSGGHVRDLMHVTDVAAAFVALLDAHVTGTVNVASGRPVTLGEVARTIGELVGRPELVRVEDAPGTPSNPKVMTADTTKLAAIGFRPQYGLRDGLATLLA
jgi:nucleoside-diphosphate-sugar epimerase